MKISRVPLAARALVFIIIVCLMMTVVPGCQKEVKPTGTITLYTSVPTAIIEELKQEFETQNPGVHLEIYRKSTSAVVSTILIVTNKPATVVEKQIEYREVIKEVPKVEKQIEYRDVVREVVKEVTVEKPIEQKEFSSKEDLEKWLAEDNAVETVFFFVRADGTEGSSDKYDCDDYALELQRRASKDGFLMSVTIIEKHGQRHMINLTTIGNNVYCIEPQTDEVWFYCHLD